MGVTRPPVTARGESKATNYPRVKPNAQYNDKHAWAEKERRQKERESERGRDRDRAFQDIFL